MDTEISGVRLSERRVSVCKSGSHSGSSEIVGVRLPGKVAVITGARSGIGLATARLFAAEGSSVVLADIEDAGAEAALIGSPCSAVCVDVAQARSVQHLVDGTME